MTLDKLASVFARIVGLWRSIKFPASLHALLAYYTRKIRYDCLVLLSCVMAAIFQHYLPYCAQQFQGHGQCFTNVAPMSFEFPRMGIKKKFSWKIRQATTWDAVFLNAFKKWSTSDFFFQNIFLSPVRNILFLMLYEKNLQTRKQLN